MKAITPSAESKDVANPTSVTVKRCAPTIQNTNPAAACSPEFNMR